ncbi:MAG: hypothetical protein AAFQ63_12160 [Cyanobacteria bacterium J06621_11]
MRLFDLLETEKMSWWCWCATADELITYGNTSEQAIARLVQKWPANHSLAAPNG